jgi:phosphosulfolactate phosphohydrolase-like enzyme
MHASILAPSHAVTRVCFTAKHSLDGYPRYRRVEFIDTTVADTIVPMLEDMGHQDVEVIDAATMCNRCQHGWDGLIHESC